MDNDIRWASTHTGTSINTTVHVEEKPDIDRAVNNVKRRNARLEAIMDTDCFSRSLFRKIRTMV